MDEKVSVIVPMYNREALISRCLDSIAAQEWPGMEIIVVDNDSSDGSMDVALDWARRNRSESEAPAQQGIMACRLPRVSLSFFLTLTTPCARVLSEAQ